MPWPERAMPSAEHVTLSRGTGGARWRRVRALAAAVALIAAPSASAAAERGWLGGVEAGYDSFRERYSIEDSDTLDSIDEFRSRLRLGYGFGEWSRSHALVEARGMWAESGWEAGARASATQRLGTSARHALLADLDIAQRGFREGGDIAFPNDYLRAFGRAGLRWRAATPVLLRLDERFEHLDYDRRTEFDYDYTRHSTTLLADIGSGFVHTASAGMRFAGISIPDSSEIEYTALTPLAEYRAWFDMHRRFYISGGLEHRDYREGSTRSDFRALLASAGAEWELHPHWSLELGNETEWYDYDTESGAYADYVECRLNLLANFNTETFQVGAGPAGAWLTSGSSAQDEYTEMGARIALEWTGTGGGWVAVSYEPGWRDYTLYNEGGDALDNAETIFSDYAYHRIDVFANLRLHRGLWFNAYADWQPEDHDREGDDATATTVSVALVQSF